MQIISTNLKNNLLEMTFSHVKTSIPCLVRGNGEGNEYFVFILMELALKLESVCRCLKVSKYII